MAEAELERPGADHAPERKVARNFLALAGGDAVARIVAFLAGAYVAREFGPGAFGAVLFASAVLLYFQNLSECGIDLLGVRHISENVSRIESVAPAILGARVVVSCVLAALVFGLGLGLAALGALPEVDGWVLSFYGLTLIAIGPNTKWIHLGLQDSRPVAVARTLGESLYLVLVLSFVGQAAELPRVPLFQLCGDVLIAATLFVWLRAKGFRIRLAFDWQLVKPIFARSWPLVANVLLGLTIYNSDLIFLRFLRDRETSGKYAAAYQLISFLINLAAAYSLSFLAGLSRVQHEREPRDSLYHTAAATMFALAIPIAVGASMLSTGIIELVYKSEFDESAGILAILVWTMPFTVSKEVDLIALVAGGREKTVMHMTAWAVGFNFALNIALIPPFGMWGAAWATLATEAIRAGFAAWCARKLEYPLTGLARFWKSAVAAGAMALALRCLPETHVLVAIGAGAATYGLVLAALGGIRFERGALPSLRV
ncbi:MAG: flippase [Planctomycetes bacterium]|nr:flippase [Planctomycetota bacterium]